MQILTSREALVNVAGNRHVGQIGLAKKTDPASLHEGHEALITYAKNNCDVVVVTFWDTSELVSVLYPEAFWFADEVVTVWDEDGCLNWCRDQGVDYVILPPLGYSTDFVESMGITPSPEGTGFGYDFVENLWTSNNYPAYEIDSDEDVGASRYSKTLLAKSSVMVNNYKTELNRTQIASWKDGFYRFTIADFINNDTTENFVLLDPVKTPDDLYYSSSYPHFTSDHKTGIGMFDSIVDSTGYSDEATLKNALNSSTASYGINVLRIDTIIGGVVGADNDFINVAFRTDSGLTDSYPIYKKGVR